jgi:hypothetical protein
MVLNVAKSMDDFDTQVCYGNSLKDVYGDALEQALI